MNLRFGDIQNAASGVNNLGATSADLASALPFGGMHTNSGVFHTDNGIIIIRGKLDGTGFEQSLDNGATYSDFSGTPLIDADDFTGALPTNVNSAEATKAHIDGEIVQSIAGAPVNGTTTAFRVGQLFWDRTNQNMYETLTASAAPYSSPAGSTFRELDGRLNAQHEWEILTAGAANTVVAPRNNLNLVVPAGAAGTTLDLEGDNWPINARVTIYRLSGASDLVISDSDRANSFQGPGILGLDQVDTITMDSSSAQTIVLSKRNTTAGFWQVISAEGFVASPGEVTFVTASSTLSLGTTIVNSALSTNQTLPVAAIVPEGSVINVKRLGAGNVVMFRGGGAEEIDGVTVDYNFDTEFAGQGDSRTFVSDGVTGWYVV